MNLLRCLLLSCALGLAPAAAKEPPPAALMGAFPGASALATFADCVNYLEAWLGPDIPDWVVHASVCTWSARKPLYDGSGQPVPGADGQQACGQIAQSGRIFYPPAWRMPFQRNLPLVVYPHFTALRKRSVPSALSWRSTIIWVAMPA